MSVAHIKLATERNNVKNNNKDLKTHKSALRKVHKSHICLMIYDVIKVIKIIKTSLL